MAAEEKWYFTKDQLASTPSQKCGYDSDKELSYRQQAANFIQDMGQRLQVTQLCINTAIVYMHRFYVFHSFTHFHRNAMAAAALFLAAKVEEQPRKLEHVIKVAHMCLNREQPPLDTKSEQYLEQAQDLVFNENVLLQTLGFDVAIDHPHTHVVRCCHLVRASKDLAQTSYFMASNSLHLTTMCLQYKPTVVACFCIHLACKWSNWEIPQSNEGKDWFWYVDCSVTLEQLERLTAEFLVIFDKCPTKLKKKIRSISATPNAVIPQGPSGTLFDTEPRKIRPAEGQEVPGFHSQRPHHSHGDQKQGDGIKDLEFSMRELKHHLTRGVAGMVGSSEDGAKKNQHGPPGPFPQPPRNDYREYKEKKERERLEREKMARDGHSQSSIPQTGHHSKPVASQMQLNDPSSKAHRDHGKSQGLPPVPVNPAREAARREQAHAREVAKREAPFAAPRQDFIFGPSVHHKDGPMEFCGVKNDSSVTSDNSSVLCVNQSISNSALNKKDTSNQDWTLESLIEAEGIRHSEKYRSSGEASKRSSGPNFDSSRHTKIVNAEHRHSGLSSGSSSGDARVMKVEHVSDHQRHNSMFSHKHPVSGDSRHRRDFPPSAISDIDAKRQDPAKYSQPPSNFHLTQIKREVKKEEEFTNKQVPPRTPSTSHSQQPLGTLAHHQQERPSHAHHSSAAHPKDRTPVGKAPESVSSRPKSSAPTQPHHHASVSKPEASHLLRNGLVHDKPVVDSKSTAGKMQPLPHTHSKIDIEDVAIPQMQSPSKNGTIQKPVTAVTDKNSTNHTVRESPYPQRSSKSSRQRTPPLTKKTPVAETPVLPASGLMSPFGSPPMATPTTPGKTPAASRSNRNRTSSSSSEPELVPVMKKLDEIPGYENIIRDSKMGIKLPGRVPDIIQPIRDRKKEETMPQSGANGRNSAVTSVAKELKPPDIIRPFGNAMAETLTQQLKVPPTADLGAVAFPSPQEGEPGSSFPRTVLSPEMNSSCVSSAPSIIAPEMLVMVSEAKTVVHPSAANIVDSAALKKVDHHHKSEKKKKKKEHKHKDKEKEKDKNKEERKHKRKHKEKDKDKHKEEKVDAPIASSTPIKITIPKGKLLSSLEPTTTGSGLKIKIQKDRLVNKTPEVENPAGTKIKIKISKDVIEGFTPQPPGSAAKESRKRDRSSPRSDAAAASTAAKQAKMSAALSEQIPKRNTSVGYPKMNGKAQSNQLPGSNQSCSANKVLQKGTDNHIYPNKSAKHAVTTTQPN